MAQRASDYKVVTVFGGSGFIGRYVVRDLARRGWRVRVATRHPDEAAFLRTAGSVGQVVPVFANIRDDASVRAAVGGSDIVVNLVGILYERGRQSFAATHQEGAARVARMAAEAGVSRVIQISAIGASENSPSQYARTKAAGEKAVLEAFSDATILRPSIVFGPEDGFFNLFARLARYSPVLPLIGGGRTRFQPVFVGDVAEAVVAALDKPETKGRTYELGGPRVYSFKELLQLMLREVNRRRLLVPVPWGVAKIQAAILGRLPRPLLTGDQLAQLKTDNVVAAGAATLADLGIDRPAAVELILPSYMDIHRAGGRFSGPSGPAGS